MAGRRIAGIDVGSVGLGGAAWSIPDAIERKRAIRTILVAIDAGVRLIDTAHAYTTRNSESHNERLIASALTQLPTANVLVATKGGHERRGDEFPIDGRPASIRRHCEASLRALAVDCIGLYQLHWPDPHVPLTETMGAFADLQREGKIRFIGLANVTIEQIEVAQRIVEIASVQNPLSPKRLMGRAVLDYCEERGIAYLAYAALGGPNEAPTIATSLPAFAGVAARYFASPQQVVLAWELALSPNLIPIVGASRPATAVDSTAAASLRLEADDLDLLTSSLSGVY
jgi:aryl-alcohol dehydrogenase-like predicted oxidoreductase